jgi:non-reducing end alpha-L-arabinofuranosidase
VTRSILLRLTHTPIGMYAVLDGTHYNGGCCFDYGNAETSSRDTGNGHMETIYFGNNKVWGTGSGNGPWIMADLENGLFSGANPKNNPADPVINYRFTTAIVKGEPNHWAIRGANAASGTLSTFYDGKRPSVNGYNPMHKEGAIILGIGGDNSNGAQGTFYEGVMTTGYPSDATENAVQEDIVAAKYATAALSTRHLDLGSIISLQASQNKRHLVRHEDGVNTHMARDVRDNEIKEQSSWIVRRGLGHDDCFSFESRAISGSYLVHEDFKLQVRAVDGSKHENEDATFCTEGALNGEGISIRSWNHPTRYVRHFNESTYAAANGGGVYDFDDSSAFHDDASWLIVDNTA